MTVTHLKPQFKQPTPAASEVASSYRLNFEVSDLFYYFGTGSTLTGIQRVQQELCLGFFGSHSSALSTLVVYDKPLQRWRIVQWDWFASLVKAARSFKAGGAAWDEIYQSFATQLSSFPLKHFEAGEWLVNVGASWALPSYFIQVRQLRRRGVRLGIFLHDCIPARHPAYFDLPHTIEHTYWLAQIRESADVIICNSEATRKDYLELVKPPSADNVHVCRLDASWVDTSSWPEADVAASDLLSDLGISEEDFVLTVGT